MTRMDSEAIRRRARVLLELGRPAEALAEAHRALAIYPNDPEALELAGLCRLRLGQKAEAAEVLAQALREGPDHAHVHYLYGFALRELDRKDEAEIPLREALKRQPDEPVYLRALAELLADQKRYAEALALARRATEVAPDRAANHVTYGYVASAAGQKAEARAAYEVAVGLDPSDAAAWNNLGCLDLEAGHVLKARARFREALRLDPRAERAQRNLTLVTPPPRPRERTWDGTLRALIEELVRGRAPKLTTLALVLEAPAAAEALVRGGRRGAALSGALTALALRAMGPAALLPLSAGAVAFGAAWLATRHALPAERRRVRLALEHGRARFEEVHRAWLEGRASREARDRDIDLLIEALAIQLAEPT